MPATKSKRLEVVHFPDVRVVKKLAIRRLDFGCQPGSQGRVGGGEISRFAHVAGDVIDFDIGELRIVEGGERLRRDVLQLWQPAAVSAIERGQHFIGPRPQGDPLLVGRVVVALDQGLGTVEVPASDE